MSQTIIDCAQISKSYKLGARRAKNVQMGAAFTMRDTFSDLMGSARRMIRGKTRPKREQDDVFWALNDVSFEVKRGEVVGLIGRNGAGKSTLLKILSRIVEPTKGKARLRGRVASLLEVGTGFHPELSGRENIYLNGAILGMRRAEIDRKLDEIVAFSEIERFLDTPVKRYSSGMYVRLAFAVAAHLEPEILIVDEVLAVGDYAFQKKCLGKMHDVASGDGRTILFVSHNMGALNQLCDRGVLLENGSVTMIGPVDEVVNRYLKSGLGQNSAMVEFPEDPSKPCQFVSVEILHEDGSPTTDFSCDEPVRIRLRMRIREVGGGVFMSLQVLNLDGVRVLNSDIRDLNTSTAEALRPGLHAFDVVIPPRLLSPTTYLVNVVCSIHFAGVVDQHESCCEFTLSDVETPINQRPGVLGARLPWGHRIEADQLG